MDSLLINSRFKASSFNLSNSNPKSLEFHLSSPVFSLKNSDKLGKRPSTILKYTNNPEDPNSKWENYSSPIGPFSAFLPVIKKIKDFAARASKIKWASSFHGCRSLEALPCEFDGGFSQNGAIGMALLSVTSTAKVKISPFVATLAANPTFVSGLFAWAIAQSIKVFLNFWVERKWDLRIMFASGGMPSSHSALCIALTTSVAICHGVADSLFPVCLWFSLIVMYDAIGVRRHAGMQAEVIA